MDYSFSGFHVIADIFFVPIESLLYHEQINQVLALAVERGGASLIRVETAVYDSYGFTAFALLKESHVSLHTYPEENAAFIDVFTCGKSNPRIIMDVLIDYFKPGKTVLTEITRGYTADN
jgi:S-adenosylmethionine decarboxylase proenzyme, Bacillus form